MGIGMGGWMYFVDRDDAFYGVKSLCCVLGGHGCCFECAIDSLLVGA